MACWDGVYFLEIAREGYIYEKQHAFYPGYPIFIRITSYLINLVFLGHLSEIGSLLLSGVIISNICFILAALSLYLLSRQVLKDERLSFTSALLFCFNPASIFMSALYTESLFALTVFAGLYYLTKNGENFWDKLKGTACFAMSSGIRSNGAILIGFIIYPFLKGFLQSPLKKWFSLYSTLFSLFQVVVISIPTVLFSVYGYILYCYQDNPQKWCNYTVPNIYSYVQSTYWDIGFLNYYEVKQIPNFILALPIISISYYGIWSYIKQDPTRFFSLGLINSSSRPPKPFFKENTLVFIYHWAFLVTFALLMMHVQVATRFIASQCPPFYWWTATLLQQNPNARTQKLISYYFTLFWFLGPILFSNFYPWS
uniref:GPI mannosyltransferase 2 n=1 Tax=Arcella intermedia TaxID=1963864 RepID=A0A6B2L764_9EUKA